MVYLHRFHILILVLLCVTLCGELSFAADAPITVEGAKLASWDPHLRILYAAGQVSVAVDDILLHGDTLLWDMDKQEMLIEGNVVLQQADTTVYGTKLLYNVETGQGEFDDVHTQLVSEKINGPIFIFSDKLQIDQGDYILDGGQLTTCDLEQPHYHLAVNRIEVYPGNKMVIRGVRYYEGRIPLFYWPYLAIPLDERFSNSDLTLPEIGYSKEDGYYIKNRYNYYRSAAAYGSILLDYYTRKSVGLGIDHKYAHKLMGNGSLALYALPLASEQYFLTQIEHQYSNDQLSVSTKGAFKQEIKNAILEQEAAGNLRLNYNSNTLRLNANFNYDLERAGGVWKKTTWTGTGSWQQQLMPNLQLNASSKIAAKDQVRVYDNLVEASYAVSSHRFTLAVQQKQNPDLLEKDKSPKWYSVNRLPELTWQWQNPGFADKKLSGRWYLSLGNFQEYPASVQAWRLQPTLELATHSWRSSFGTVLNYSGTLSGYFYQTGQNQLVAAGRINLTQQLGSSWRLAGSYSKKVVKGETPFSFDQESAQDLLTGTLTYSNQPITWLVRTGYDFHNNKFQTLTTQFSYTANYAENHRLSSSLQINYDITKKQFENLTARVNYQPQENWVFNTGIIYHLGKQKLDQIDGKIAFTIADKIQMSYEVLYDPDKTQKFQKGEVVLIYDLHCRQLRMSYNQVNQEFKVQYSINAFPKLPIGVSSKSGISLFKLEDLRDLFTSD